ncbi:MAG: S8 family serine peptidase [Actinomycetota bacterium]
MSFRFVRTWMAVLATVAVLSASLVISTSFATADERGQSFQDGRLLVGFARGTSLIEKQRIAAKHGASILSEFHGLDAALVAVPPGSVLRKQLELGTEPAVSYAEPDYFLHASITPNDPYFASQWNLDRIQAGAAWDTYPGNFGGQGAAGTGVTVAIVDTGMKVQEDLNDGRAFAGANCVIGACTAGGSADDNGHGTHVAGIAAATTNNLKGVAGVSFNSRLLPVKVLNSSGSGTYAAAISGITWAAQNGAKVINLSLGASTFSSALCNAVANAVQNYSALVVAASGNDGLNGVLYPAACPEALAVGSTNETDARSYFSNYGSSLFIAAPGENINSTLPICCTQLNSPTGYGILSGTSMASPHVAGLAALIAGRLGGATTTLQNIKIALAKGADKVGATAYGADPRNLGCNPGCTWNQYFGYGRINALKSLQYNAGPDFTLSSAPASQSINQGQSANYTININRVGGFADSVTLSASGLPSGSTVSFNPNPTIASSTVMTVSTTSSTPAGTYTITVSGTNGTLTRTTTVSLGVVVPDFRLSVSPASVTVSPAASGNYSITITRVGGYSADVSLSVTGLPASTTASFSPNPVTGSNSSLTVVTTSSTPVGTYPLTITGSSGALNRTANATLIVSVGRTERQSYIGVTGDVLNFDCSIVNVGGVCFTLQSTDKIASATIEDASGWRIGGFYRFLSSTSVDLGNGFFCNEMGSVTVPPGAKFLQVYVEEAFSTLDCAGSVGAGTYGHVTGRFQ